MTTSNQQLVNNFYALLRDGAIRKITLDRQVSAEVKDIFVNAANELRATRVEEIKFEGNYRVDEDEILFVDFKLPEKLINAISNPISIQVLDLEHDVVRALFWTEQKEDKSPVIYFQNFDARKVLKNKHIFTFSSTTYTKLEENAFIIDETVSLVFDDNKLFFRSYANANKIFSLSEFYQAATDADIDTFSKHKTIKIDAEWVKKPSNSSLRKQITLIQKSNILQGIDVGRIKQEASNFELNIEVDDGKICFPNELKACKEILTYLNENLYVGPITGTKFKTNSHTPFKR